LNGQLAGAITMSGPTEGVRMTPDAASLRETEHRRLRSLVEGDVATAEALHADDYQLITPLGYALSKQEYLGSIASGEFRYLKFEAVSDIAVRGGGGFALLRYQARIWVDDIGVVEPFNCWHTDSYELRAGRWQAVWSQATRIRLGD
jgi:Domain of unknown function (DUF4440)